MKNISHLVASLSALALLSASVLYAESETQLKCTPELEGKMIMAGSGLLQVRFEGRITAELKDGSINLPESAWLARADDPCPWLKGRAIKVSQAGEFHETYVLLTDTHWFCQEGKPIRDYSIAPANILLSAPGCEPIEIQLNPDSQYHEISLLCSADLMESQRTLDSLRQTGDGATAEIRGRSLFIDGKPIAIPAPLSDLESILGEPSEIVISRADKYSNDVWEWSNSGVYAYVKPGDIKAHAVVFLLEPLSNDRHWCNPGTASLFVDGIEISKKTSKRHLRKAGFKLSRDGWEKSWPDMYLGLNDAIGDGTNYFLELEIGTN